MVYTRGNGHLNILKREHLVRIGQRIEKILEGNLLVTEGTFWHTSRNVFTPKNDARV